MKPRQVHRPAEGKPGPRARAPGRGPVAWLGLALLLLLPGCGLLRAPQQMVTAVVPGSRPKGPAPVELQVQLQRFADDYSAQTMAAIDEYVRRVGTEDARVDGLRWKLAASSAAVGVASGAQPKASLLDLVSLATLTRMTLEERMATSTNREAAVPWLESARFLESNAWTLASSTLEPAQVEELRTAIQRWHGSHPEIRSVFFARPQEFASMIKSARPAAHDVTSVFSWMSLDPTSGLDPAVREITLTRLFAERALYTAQRSLPLLRLQVELLTAELTRQPDMQRALAGVEQISGTLERLGRTAAQVSDTAVRLPDRITAERQAILSALDQQEGRLRELAAEVNRALASGEAMTKSLNTTLVTFDALMKRFGVGEPGPTNAAPPDTNARPFDIRDYGQVATQVSGMARELNTLLTTANQTTTQGEQLGRQAEARAEAILQRGFRLGLILIGVFLGGVLVVALSYRILASRLIRREPRGAPMPPP